MKKMYIIIVIIIVAILVAGAYFIFRPKDYNKLSDRDKAVYLAGREIQNQSLNNRQLITAESVPGQQGQWLVFYNIPNSNDAEVWITVDINKGQVIKVLTAWGGQPVINKR